MPPQVRHPLDPLSPEEITLAARILKESYPQNDVIFRVITLQEPPKAELFPYLVAERASKAVPVAPARIATVQFYLNSSAKFREVKVDLGTGQVSAEKDLAGKQSYTDAEEMQRMEIACLADHGVQSVIKAMELPENAVVCIEAWTYGTDGLEDMSKRIIMCYFYMRLGEHLDANHFAYPLDVCAEMSDQGEVLKILQLPSGIEDRMFVANPTNVKKYDKRKIHAGSEYHPELLASTRTSTKPYNVVQPDGPSFHIEGNLLTWEKWRMRIGFNFREGLTLHDITYDGRSLFYRLSLSEMFVPYGDSRAPYPRKAAFDLGNNGAGVNANNLQLGCDCLGAIKYFNGYHHTLKGEPLKMPNVICCHEVDDGILWKHTNYRTNNAIVARSRVLVLQTIITVGNYEYIFAFQFTQAATIRYEVRATGILSTNPIDLGDTVPFGDIVAPGVMAPFHQHLFSLRIDPAIDGQHNSLAVTESEAMPLDKVHNPFGVGYITKQQIVESETPIDTDVTKGRTFRIINESSLNHVTNHPVSYEIVPHYSQMLLSHPTSFHAKRSEFADHAFWVTQYRDEELYSAGNHTMQSEGGVGIQSWIKERPEKLSVRKEDIVLWHTFGTTHNPRPEDWPVMPEERMTVTLKPVGFFERNPGIDVAPSRQEDNKSVLVANGCGKC